MSHGNHPEFSMRLILTLAIAALFFILAAPALQAKTGGNRAQILLVGIDHLGKKHDVHNSPSFDPLTPERQSEIKAVIEGIARFRPTKVMVERDFGDAKTIGEYQQYLQGKFTLGGNEVYQYGFRLAAMAHNPTIYPIDTIQEFPFDYEGMLASADKHGQKQILDAAEVELAPYLKHMDELVLHGTIGDELRYLNEPKSLAIDGGWYTYAARIGDGSDYAGADLVSIWYARNVHIYANMMRNLKPGDRVVVFIGAGHAPSLRWMIAQSPDLQLMDTEKYLHLPRNWHAPKQK